MRIILIRHGMTKGNTEKRYVSSTDESLIEQGKSKLFELTKKVSQIVDSDNVKKVFLSPMKRCIETAEILFPQSERVPFFDLRECDFGDYEYKNFKELDGHEAYQRYIDTMGESAFPNGETKAEFILRVASCFETIIKNEIPKMHENDVLVFVVHGGTIMAILDVFSSPHKDYFEWQIEPGECYVSLMNETLNLTNVKKLL